ncbi:hypothetical protein JCM8202_001755 [Rhodotorula sphaerocarpa]
MGGFQRIARAIIALACAHSALGSAYPGLGLHNDNQSGLSLNGVPATTRTKWMRVANNAVPEILGSGHCSHFPFGVAVVNTTSDELVCVAANQVGITGNPSLHGEISGLKRCTKVLTERGLSPTEILEAWRDLSMYTTGEPCPMCASALRWAGMGEVIWATSIETIIRGGRNQIYLPSSLIVSASYSLPHQTHWFGSVLANETDPGFLHQFDEAVQCPEGCYRGTVEGSRVSTCLPTEEWVADWKGREGEWERQLMETRGRIAEDWYGVKANGGGIRSHDEL